MDDDTITTRGTEQEGRAKKMTYMSAGKLNDAGSVINVTRLNTNLRHLPGPALRTGTNGICCQLCC